MRKIWWALILAGIVTVASGWWLGWDFSHTFDIAKWTELSASWKNILNNNFPAASTTNRAMTKFRLKGGFKFDALREAGRSVQDTIVNGLGEAVQKQQDAAAETVKEIGDSVMAGVQEQAGEIIQFLGEGMGLDVNVSSATTSKATSFVVVVVAQLNKPVSFLVRNSSSSTTNYLIDWGDGRKASGFLTGNQEKIIEHSWDAVGDYIISFASREFLVRVIN